MSAFDLAGNGGGGSYPCVGDADKAVSPTSGTSPGGSHPYDTRRGKVGEMGAHTSNTGMKGKVVIWKRSEGFFFKGVESGRFSCLSWLFFWGCPAECFEREVDHAKKGKETTQGGQHLPAATAGSPGPRSDNSSACEAPAGWDFLGEPRCTYGFFPGSCWVFKDEFLR